MVAVTRARVCLAGGTSNPVKDLSETLGLFFYECRVQGVAFVEKPVVGLIDPQRVRCLGTSARGSCCTFEPCHRLAQQWRDLQQECVRLYHGRLSLPYHHELALRSLLLPIEVLFVKRHLF